jgi:uncharacterized protein (TIGR02246 family)
MSDERPEDLLHQFAVCWNAGDAAGLGALFAEDADFVNVVGLWWRRRRDIARAHNYAFQRYFRNAQLSLEEIAVRQLRDDVATVHGRWRLEGQRDPGGAEAPARCGIMVLVAEKAVAGWRIVTAQNTDIAQGAETQMIGDGGLEPVSYCE